MKRPTRIGRPPNESGYTLIEVIMALFILSIAVLAYVSVAVTRYQTNQIEFQRRLALSRLNRKVVQLSLMNPATDPDLETTTSPITSYSQYHTETQIWGNIEYTIYWCVRTEADLMNAYPGGWSSTTPSNTLWVNVFIEWKSFRSMHRAQALTFAILGN